MLARAVLCSLSAVAAAALAPAVEVETMEIGKDKDGKSVKMPMLLLGTGYMPKDILPNVTADQEARPNVKMWIEAGARGLDCAMVYNDQAGVKEGIADSGVDRKELFILTKVPGGLGYDNTIANFQRDLDALGTDYVDHLALHWCAGYMQACPVEDITGPWKALEDLYHQGKARTIGIGNFCLKNVEDLMTVVKIKPHLHQVECHPGFSNTAERQQAVALGLNGGCYAPLSDLDGSAAGGPGPESEAVCGGKELLKTDTVQSIAKAHGMSAAQVLLRWQLDQKQWATPRVEKANAQHIAENIAAMAVANRAKFALTKDEIAALDKIPDNTKCWSLADVCPENTPNRTAKAGPVGATHWQL